MKNIKLAIGSSLAALALVVGLSVPAGAQPTETGPGDNINNETRTIHLGDCAGIITSVVVQSATNLAANSQNNTSAGGLIGDNEATQSNESTTSASSVQEGGVYFAPNCSKTTNVSNVTHKHTHVTQAAAQTTATTSQQGAQTSSRNSNGVGAGAFTVAASQVPSGGVSAGAGGSIKEVTAPLAGAISSLAAFSFGAVRLLKFEA